MSVKQITYENIDPKVRSMIMVGLTLAMLIVCLDGTIVSTCGATIASELNGIVLYSWMVTAYMLCETVMIPISGKLSDLYGRKPVFLVGLALFVAEVPAGGHVRQHGDDDRMPRPAGSRRRDPDTCGHRGGGRPLRTGQKSQDAGHARCRIRHRDGSGTGPRWIYNGIHRLALGILHQSADGRDPAGFRVLRPIRS